MEVNGIKLEVGQVWEDPKHGIYRIDFLPLDNKDELRVYWLNRYSISGVDDNFILTAMEGDNYLPAYNTPLAKVLRGKE